MTQLDSVPGGNIFHEPCSSCDGDQHIFKGVFVRHLSAMLQTGLTSPALLEQANAFLVANADSLLANSSCGQESFGLLWEGPCGLQVSLASTSAGLDLLTAASIAAASSTLQGSSEYVTLGLGNCIDASGASMPNCFNDSGEIMSEPPRCLIAYPTLAMARCSHRIRVCYRKCCRSRCCRIRF